MDKILNLLKEPLVHFLLAGLGLFIFYGWISGPGSDDPRVITVDRSSILTFLQFRSKAFDEKRVSEAFDKMEKEQRDQLIEDYVREEALYREAQALELERNDYVIKRRLIQKLEFITKGFTSTNLELSDADVKAYFEKNKEKYRLSPIVTFTHVYFGADKRGKEQAAAAAKSELKRLRSRKVQFSDAVKYGDRFPFHVNYVERDPDFVGSHFGKEMAGAIFDSETKKDVWAGPYESEYGSHLVLVSKKTEGGDADFEEISGRVKEDLRVEREKELLEKSEQTIIDGYEVRNQLK